MAKDTTVITLTALPDEVLLQILWYLDIPELLAISRVRAPVSQWSDVSAPSLET